MPKYCIGCKETKSKSLFFKGKIVCKDCQESGNVSGVDLNETSSIAPTTIDEESVNIVANISTISLKLSLLEETSRNISMKLDAMSNMPTVLNTVSSLPATLDNMLTKMQDIPVVLDMLRDLPMRLSALERRVASIERTNIVQEILSRNQVTDDTDEE